MIDRRRSCSMASRSGFPGARMSCWPTNSSKVAGRIRSARGVPAAFAAGVSVEGSSNRDIMLCARAMRLSERLVEHERGGDADVQRFDGLVHGNRDAPIDLPQQIVGQARSFAAENQRRWLSEVCTRTAALRARGTSAIGRDAAPSKRGSTSAISARAIGSRSALPIEPRSAFHPSGSAVAAVVDERGGARRFGRAHDAAHIARILNVVRDDDERVRGMRAHRPATAACAARCRPRPRASAPGSSSASVFRDTMNTSAPSASELFGERPHGRIGERVLFERRAFDRQSRFARLEQEMRAVEQQLAFVSVCGGLRASSR